MACLLLLGICLWGTDGRAAEAQDAAVAAKDEPIHTLHVYTNLIQIPTLVLGSSHDVLKKPIGEERFSVSIDEGPWFRATHVRQEGDDPVSLSILLDVSGDTSILMPKIAETLSEVARSSLHSTDTVSVYALDCELVSSLKNAPVKSDSIGVATNAVLASWIERRKQKQNCAQSVHLWDALGHVVAQMEAEKRTGRRVILAVTDGHDLGSRLKWDQVMTFAGLTGTAVFGLSYVAGWSTAGVPMSGRRGGVSYFPGSTRGDASDWVNICETSGGVLSTTSDSKALESTLEQIVRMWRQRYIVEFPRPSNGTAGKHDMRVRVVNSNYFVRWSGISVPLPDAGLMSDPTTIQAGPAVTPQQGTPKPKQP